MQKSQSKQVVNQEVQQQLSKQTALQLVSLLKDPKIQVKYGSLNAILSYSKSQQSKRVFLNSQLFSQINKFLNTAQLTKLCLSLLIHFSSLAQFQQQFPRFVQPLIFNLKQWQNDLREQLSLLVLLNITKYESVILKLLNLQDQQKKGFLLQVLYGFIQIKPIRRWVVVNVFVNVASIQQGRKYLTQEKVYLRFINYINSENQATRLAVLKLFRNCVFEWENQEFISVILSNQYDFVNKIAQHMLYIIRVAKLYQQTQQNTAFISTLLLQYQPIPAKSSSIISSMKISSLQKSLSQICLSIDILLVLSNSNFAERKVQIKQNPLKEIISILKFCNIAEEYKDKLQALEVFCFY